MEEEIMQMRMLAVRRFKASESPGANCISPSKSNFRLYKRVKMFDGGVPSYYAARTFLARDNATRSSSTSGNLLESLST